MLRHCNLCIHSSLSQKHALADSQGPFHVLIPHFQPNSPGVECTRQLESLKPVRSSEDAGEDGIWHCQAFSD